MDWTDIVRRDPYLSGSLAAAEWEWFLDITAEQEADSVGLVGEQRDKFLQGWHDELNEREQERKEQLVREYEAMTAGYEKGDPAAR